MEDYIEDNGVASGESIEKTKPMQSGNEARNPLSAEIAVVDFQEEDICDITLKDEHSTGNASLESFCIDSLFQDEFESESNALNDGEVVLGAMPTKKNTSNTNGTEDCSNNENESPIIRSGDYVAEKISDGAMFINKSLLSVVVPNVTGGLDAIGKFAKKRINCNQQSPVDKRTEILAKVYSDASMRGTGLVREAASTAAIGIRDASSRCVSTIADKCQEKDVVGLFVADKEVHDAIVATGKVAVASLGAAAIVLESLFETSKAVAQKSVSVTADVASYKYGNNVGKVIQNTGDATGNVLSTLTHIATLEGGALSKEIARNTAKVKVKQNTHNESMKKASGIESVDKTNQIILSSQ